MKESLDHRNLRKRKRGFHRRKMKVEVAVYVALISVHICLPGLSGKGSVFCSSETLEPLEKEASRYSPILYFPLLLKCKCQVPDSYAKQGENHVRCFQGCHPQPFTLWQKSRSPRPFPLSAKSDSTFHPQGSSWVRMEHHLWGACAAPALPSMETLSALQTKATGTETA